MDHEKHAQIFWKSWYSEWKRDNTFGRNRMYRYRREAALERALAAMQRRAEAAEARADALEAERDTLRAQLEQARKALALLANDPITNGMSAHYRATCSGAYKASDERIDPYANAISILEAQP